MDNIVTGIWWAMIAAALFWTVVWAANLPTVQRSSTTRECVAVIDTTGTHSCANLPTLYHAESVAPR